MIKNKKASIISLEVLIGVVVSIIIIVSAVTIISRFYRLSDASKDSFTELVALIEEVNQNDHGTREIMLLRMDKDTAIIGFTKDDEKFKGRGWVQSGVGAMGDYSFLKPIDKGCEKDKACICLCRELDTELQGGEIKCNDKNLICKTFEELEFSNPFIISNSLNFYEKKEDTEQNLEQFRAIDVEKYGEYGENSVAVCEETEEDSCISKEYKDEKRAIYNLKYFKSFIESCKDRREFTDVENPEPCSCGVFDFRSFIPEKYDIEFSESENNKLNITLIPKGEERELGSIEVDTPFCEYRTERGEISIVPEKPITSLDGYIDLKYPLNAEPNPETPQIKPQIAFIKYDEENICLAYDDPSYGKTDTDPDTIVMKAYAGAEPHPNEIPGCEYSIVYDEYLY